MRKLLRRLLDDQSTIAAGKATDTLALNLLGDIDLDTGFMPWTRAAMRPSTIVHVLNEIIINKRRSIIEFGAGISTLYFAWAARKTKSTFISIEENEDWANMIRSMLQENDLDAHCDLHFVPRQKVSMPGYDGSWYEVDRVKQIVGEKTLDLVVVDGPTAFRPGDGNARRPAVDVLGGNLADRYAIFLDDALRAGEQQILAAWEAMLGEKAVVDAIAGGHAYIGRGDRYFSGL